MTYLVRKEHDARALAASLLPTFKDHARIDNTDDDAQAELTLARAISQLERQYGIAIAPQVWAWVWGYDPLGFRGRIPTREAVPVKNVYSYSVDFNGDDISAQFSLVAAADLTGESFLYNPTGFIPGAVIELSAGYQAADDIDVTLLDLILRYAAYLWENREAAADNKLDFVPDWVNQAWAAFWVPRV